MRPPGVGGARRPRRDDPRPGESWRVPDNQPSRAAAFLTVNRRANDGDHPLWRPRSMRVGRQPTRRRMDRRRGRLAVGGDPSDPGLRRITGKPVAATEAPTATWSVQRIRHTWSGGLTLMPAPHMGEQLLFGTDESARLRQTLARCWRGFAVPDCGTVVLVAVVGTPINLLVCLGVLGGTSRWAALGVLALIGIAQAHHVPGTAVAAGCTPATVAAAA